MFFRLILPVLISRIFFHAFLFSSSKLLRDNYCQGSSLPDPAQKDLKAPSGKVLRKQQRRREQQQLKREQLLSKQEQSSQLPHDSDDGGKQASPNKNQDEIAVGDDERAEEEQDLQQHKTDVIENGQ